MPVLQCGGCPRLISVSNVPGGNPAALADRVTWSLTYRTCKKCHKPLCDECAPVTNTACRLCDGALTPLTADKKPKPLEKATPTRAEPDDDLEVDDGVPDWQTTKALEKARVALVVALLAAIVSTVGLIVNKDTSIFVLAMVAQFLASIVGVWFACRGLKKGILVFVLSLPVIFFPYVSVALITYFLVACWLQLKEVKAQQESLIASNRARTAARQRRGPRPSDPPQKDTTRQRQSGVRQDSLNQKVPSQALTSKDTRQPPSSVGQNSVNSSTPSKSPTPKDTVLQPSSEQPTEEAADQTHTKYFVGPQVAKAAHKGRLVKPSPSRMEDIGRAQERSVVDPAIAKERVNRSVAYIKMVEVDCEEGKSLEISLDGLPAGMEHAKLDAPVAVASKGQFVVFFVVDEGDAFSFVSTNELKTACMSTAQLHQAGLRNLAAVASDNPGLTLRSHGAVRYLLVGGHFEAAMMLLDELWDGPLKRFAPNGFVVAAPSRDICALCDAKSAEGIAALQDLSARVTAGSTHLLSPKLLTREGGRWVEFLVDKPTLH